jgi:hypothetical protein
MPQPLDPFVKLERENVRLKVDNSSLRALNKRLLRRGGGYDEFLEDLKEILTTDKDFQFKTVSKLDSKIPADPNHEEIICVACSDLHLTENVRSVDANGINAYNTMIAANRLWEHSQKVKRIVSGQRRLHKVSKLWSPLLGDMVNGSIHPEMIYTNELPDPAAVVLCTRLLYMFYQELKGLKLPIEIDTALGNHPRLTVKMPTKRQAHTNLDWIIYENLADRFSGDDQVDMIVHTSQIAMKKLYGWNYVFEHGIDVKSGAEDLLEGRIRGLFDSTTYREAVGFTGASFDQIVIGNLHRPKFLERVIINGCYTGQNELGMSWRLAPIRAMQMLWGVSKKEMRTFQYGIDLTGILSEKPYNPFSEYAQWFLRRHGKQ